MRASEAEFTRRNIVFDFLQRHPRVARVAEIVGQSVLLNLLMLLSAATIVGLAPAIAGGFSYAQRLVRRQTLDVVEHFFRPMRSHFLGSWMIGLASAALIGFAVANFILVTSADIPLGGVVATLGGGVAALVLCANLYAWPLLVTSGESPATVLVFAGRLALGHLPWSLFVLGLCAVPATLTVVYPAFGGIVGVGAIAVIGAWGSWRVVRHYQVAGPPR